mmetsp:Transcript_22445/g.71103  ORF Transcript_22445/g.71103 Transcript_22445/m.71103 type:complete len:783 (-) Transcript_22445:62-2410(-)
MSIKKRTKVGRIEPSTDGTAVVVHLTTEITHFDEDGMPGAVEKIPDRKEVSVGKALRRAKVEDLPSLAQDIADKCKYIPSSKVRQVEQALAKLLDVQMPLCSPSPPPAAPPPGASPNRQRPHSSRPRRGNRQGAESCTPPQLVIERPADVLPQAFVDKMDDYADELYEESMEAKAAGAQRLLRLCADVGPLEEVSEHPTLLGVLSRELRENVKRSHELAVAITGIFLCLAHFSQFHGALGRHQCGEATMRVVEFEGKRVKALQKELKLTQGRVEARGSEVTKEERLDLQREERRYQGIVERQDRLLHLCVLVLRDLAEDTGVERGLVKQKICHYLLPLLGRSSEELLLCVLGFLHKLSVFEKNKDVMVQNTEALSRLADLAGHSSSEVALLALRLCFNISFDPNGRMAFATQTGLLARLLSTFQLPHLRGMSLKLLYHLSIDSPVRATIAGRHPGCIGAAVHLVARGKEAQLERDAVALCVNLAAEASSAAVMVEAEHFPRLVQRATLNSDPLLLKIVRNASAHKAVRQRLLRAMQSSQGYADWLLDLTRLACRLSDRPEVLVEVLGTLAGLDCASPAVPWPELCDVGLLDLMHRQLIVGFSEDDVLLECIILAGVLALDPDSVPLLAASKVPFALAALLTEKQDDGDIVVQLLHTLRCLLLQEETSEVVLQETDAAERILEVLEGYGGQAADAKSRAVQAVAEEVLDLIVDLEERDDREPRWTERIKLFRFEQHNYDWAQMLRRGDQYERSERNSAVETRSGFKWTDVGGLAERCWDVALR